MINSHLIASAGHGCTMNTCFSNLHTFDREHKNSTGVTQSGHKNCMVEDIFPLISAILIIMFVSEEKIRMQVI